MGCCKILLYQTFVKWTESLLIYSVLMKEVWKKKPQENSVLDLLGVCNGRFTSVRHLSLLEASCRLSTHRVMRRLPWPRPWCLWHAAPTSRSNPPCVRARLEPGGAEALCRVRAGPVRSLATFSLCLRLGPACSCPAFLVLAFKLFGLYHELCPEPYDPNVGRLIRAGPSESLVGRSQAAARWHHSPGACCMRLQRP